MNEYTGKQLSEHWMPLATKLGCRTKSIAIALASAYRQGQAEKAGCIKALEAEIDRLTDSLEEEKETVAALTEPHRPLLKRIVELEAENAALRERLAAIRSFAYGNVAMHDQALQKSDIDKAIDAMVAEIVALREDKARLDWIADDHLLDGTYSTELAADYADAINTAVRFAQEGRDDEA